MNAHIPSSFLWLHCNVKIFIKCLVGLEQSLWHLVRAVYCTRVIVIIHLFSVKLYPYKISYTVKNKISIGET